MKSLLFNGSTPFIQPAACAPGRKEVTFAIKKAGRIYRVFVRDKVTVEDPYLMMVKAAAFAIQSGEPYSAQVVARSVRNFLIRSNVVI